MNRSGGAPAPYAASSFLSIRSKHIEALERMLNFNNPVDSKTSWQENWKILIYDNFCRDMISTLFKVADLRKHGVTLHLHIDSDRQQVQDVSAVYFVSPTTSNVMRIAKDCSAGLYDACHLNFSSSISQEELHRLATAVAESDSASRIEKVFDQYMSFISLDHTLFSLHMTDTYLRLNDPQMVESDMDALVNGIVNALFAVLVTLQVVPIIRCPRQHDAAGLVGERLNKRLHDHLLSTNNLFRDQAYSSGSYARPMLIIIDRSHDLAVNLQHGWAYDALLHDVLGMSLNKVTVTDPDAPPAAGGGAAARARPAKTYDLGANDAFWMDNNGQPFPKVTDEIELRLAAWKQQYDAIAAQGAVEDPAGAGAGGAAGHPGGGGGGIEALTKAAQRVPELTERKRLLDQHTAICTALLSAIQARELDQFYSLETAIVSGSVYNAKSALLQVLGAEAKGSGEDKLRLLVIYYLCSPSLSDSDVSEYTAALSALGLDLSVLTYLQHLRKMKQLSSRALALGGGGGGGGGGRGGLSLTDIMSKVRAGTETATGLLKSVAANLGGRRELPVTRAVDALMEGRAGPEADDYACLDPHVHDDSGARPKDGRKPAREAIVFVVGGGNYVEYGDLQESARRAGRNVIYGTTEMVTGSEFLAQLSRLGRLFAGK